MEIYKKSKFIENSFVRAVKKHINGDFSAHGHNFFEIEFILSGTGTYIIDGIPYAIDKNMLFYYHPSTYNQLKTIMQK